MLKYLISIFFICFSFFAQAQEKRALVIGLGQYEDTSWSVIHGDKDIPIVLAMLKGYGHHDVQILVNAQATKKHIIDRFKQLMRKCRKGDVVYIHFSEHGQRMTDVDGDEADGLDEAWVPYDGYLQYGDKDRGEKHLVDDEIGVLLTDIRNKIDTSDIYWSCQMPAIVEILRGI